MRDYAVAVAARKAADAHLAVVAAGVRDHGPERAGRETMQSLTVPPDPLPPSEGSDPPLPASDAPPTGAPASTGPPAVPASSELPASTPGPEPALPPGMPVSTLLQATAANVTAASERSEGIPHLLRGGPNRP